MKPSDYIIVKFETSNKGKLIYKYVASVLKIADVNDIEIQCFESIDKENTEFVPIDNDVSMIGIESIVGKLPIPELKLSGRQLKSVFPGVVDVFEKF